MTAGCRVLRGEADEAPQRCVARGVADRQRMKRDERAPELGVRKEHSGEVADPLSGASARRGRWARGLVTLRT
jgi:hypothetical protein